MRQIEHHGPLAQQRDEKSAARAEFEVDGKLIRSKAPMPAPSPGGGAAELMGRRTDAAFLSPFPRMLKHP